MENKDTTFFTKFYSVNVNEKTEQKNGLTYLSWAWAWKEFKTICPDATYEVVKFDGRPYFSDPDFGIMVYTSVTANGITHEMWLPVMDSSNRAMKVEPYTYQVWNREKKIWVEKTVAPADMFDINKTIMRCLTKNLAMFGLGLYIYAGEDLPEEIVEDIPAQPIQQAAAADAANTRRKPAGKKEKPYEPLEPKAYYAIIEKAAKNIPSLSGKPYRDEWIERTNAKAENIEQFDADVNAWRTAHIANH